MTDRLLSASTSLAPTVRRAGPFGRRPKLAFAGHSIGVIHQQFQAASPFFWSQVRAPRLYDYVLLPANGVVAVNNPANTTGALAIGGTKSGTLTNGAGTTLYTAIDGTDSNTPIRLAQLAAYQPDILVIDSGVNDVAYAVGPNDTFLNNKALVDACNPPHVIVFPIIGNTGAWVVHYNGLLREWARVDPRIHFIDTLAVTTDPTGANTWGPLGVAGAFSQDGTHPTVNYGRLAEPLLTDVLDKIGVPRTYVRLPHQADAYANTAYANNQNLFGTRGSMIGTGGNLTGGATGVVAAGWQLSTTNAELIATGAKSTITYRGKPVPAQKISLSTVGGAALTSQRFAGLTNFGPTSTSPTGNIGIEVSCLIRVVNPVNIEAVTFSFPSMNAAAVNTSSFIKMGLYNDPAGVDSDILPSGIDEIWEMVMPGVIKPDSGSWNNIGVQIYCTNGRVPSGDIYIGAMGLYPQIAIPTTL